jgi:uncharacterized protein (DUF983 family)
LSLQGRPVVGTLARGARLRCPACGGAGVFRSPFRVRPECPACGAVFQREEGFFVGAIMINVVTTEAAVMATAGLWLLTTSGRDAALLPLLFAVALARRRPPRRRAPAPPAGRLNFAGIPGGETLISEASGDTKVFPRR